MSNARHHLKAYVVFLLVSILLVGLLAYLYTPFNIHPSQYINSQIVTISGEEYVSAEPIVSESPTKDPSVAKRIRLTNLLLRYQKELAELESQSDLSSQAKTDRIEILRIKIQELQKTIMDLVK